MKVVICSLILITIAVFWSVVADQFVKGKQTNKTHVIQRLIDTRIELEIVISEQSKTIDIQAEALKVLEDRQAEIFKTALEVAGENYALHKVIDEMTVSMKQMLEYIQRLEEELRDRDA